MLYIKLIKSILLSKLSRLSGRILTKPFNLTLSITKKCNSQCKTCNIWKEQNNNLKELNLIEWKQILSSIGKSPVWITLSGGEPFLREDINELVYNIQKYNSPEFITIPTNGILTEKIVKDVTQILKFYKKNLIINVSIDGISEEHNKIRCQNSFKQAIKTYNELMILKKKYNNLNIGIHTVISKFNYNSIPKLIEYVQKLAPDNHIFEIAENRTELHNLNDNISISKLEYNEFIKKISEQKQNTNNKTSKLISKLREKYYNTISKVLQKNKEIIPCYAGIASSHINYDGTVWECCMNCNSLGNLRDTKFDFNKIWHSKKANEIRKQIKLKKCFCTLANSNYTNMMCEFP